MLTEQGITTALGKTGHPSVLRIELQSIRNPRSQQLLECHYEILVQ